MTEKASGAEGRSEGAEIDAAERELLETYGIKRVSTAVYLVGGYRYSALADAVAQARRR